MTRDAQESENPGTSEEASLGAMLVAFAYLVTASLVFASAMSLGWSIVVVPVLGFPPIEPWQMWGILVLGNQLKGRTRSKSGVWTVAELDSGVREAWIQAGSTWLQVGLLWMMFG